MFYFNSICFHSDNLNILTRAANLLGNFFLTPVRYTWGCRTGTCFLIVVNNTYQKDFSLKSESFYGNIEEKKSSLLKTALSIAFFVPSLIVGTVFKAPALLCSETLRTNYKNFEGLTRSGDKAYHELQIGIFFKKENHINNYSKYVEKMEAPKTFFKILDGINFFVGGDKKRIDATLLSKLKDKK